MTHLVWKTQGCQLKIASARIRCLLPALSLERVGFKSVMIEKNESVDLFNNVSALIFVKSFSKHDHQLALRAYQQGTPIVLDLCDNIFLDEYVSDQVSCFKKMAELASVIVTTTDDLSRLIRQQNIQTEVIVIPDQIEDEKNIHSVIGLIKEWRRRRFDLLKNKALEFTRVYFNKATRLKNYRHAFALISRRISWLLRVIKSKCLIITRGTEVTYDHSSKKVIIWFGNHGAPYSSFGYVSLCSIQQQLEAIDKMIPIKLVVVSNSKARFDELISRFNIETEYKKWSLFTIFNEIRSADVCVLPILKDAFSSCKSSNRALLALSLGKPVVTSSTSSMSVLSEFMELDNFYQGTLNYLTDNEYVNQHVNNAKKAIFDAYGPDVIRNKWSELLSTLPQRI
jgi:glycosyltransferase involved in cell wall biosynthesis